ncbi:MAG: hypothetical protein KAU94_09895 [Verrucomicrobia bacterium]|nr:hypothetical protein [Verrucomicrobiota bacterium]
MKWMIAVLVWGMCLSCFSAEDYRIFTDREGRVIEAKVVRFDPRSGKVTIERDNRRKATVSITIFSEADQTYIKESLLSQDFMSNSKLRISITKKKGKAPDGDNGQSRKSPCHYEIRLMPSKETSFEAIRIEYCMYIQTTRKRGADSLSIRSGHMDSVHLVAGTGRVEKTKEIELFRTYQGIDNGPGQSMSYLKESESYLKGIRVRVYLKTPGGHEFMREICEPASLAKKYEWKESSAERNRRRSNAR